MHVRTGAWLLFGALALAPAHALAQNPDESTRTAARALGTAGVEAYQTGDFATAADKLDKAYSLLRAPSLGLWSGRSLVKLGKWVEAAERFLEVTSLQVPTGDYAVQKKAQSDAAAELAALRPRIPTLVVQVEGAAIADCTFTVDGRAVASAVLAEGRLVDPGVHLVEGHHGSDMARAEVTAAEGEKKTIVLRFSATPAVAPLPAPFPTPPPPAPSPPPPKTEVSALTSTQRTWGWVGIGVGGAGVLAGAISGLVAIGKKSDLDNNPNCQGNRCAPSEKSAVDSYNTLRTVSSVGLFAGGTVAVVGAVLLFTAPSGASAQAFVGPRTAGVRGSF